jgi:hypothetical protein
MTEQRVSDERLAEMCASVEAPNIVAGASLDDEEVLALDLRDARAEIAALKAERDVFAEDCRTRDERIQRLVDGAATLKAERDDAVDKLRRWGYVENPQQQLQLSRAQVAALEKRRKP